MARSPSHKFGQIIGELLETAVRPFLENIATEHGLYLDHKHPRPARGGKRKVAWRDYKANEHDLDYVLEEGGSETVLGKPKAFIEIAWRRYTKHSRNKTQEIQGAVVPLAETYRDSRPFLGVIPAGVFTNGSLMQLRSHGFHILYYPYDCVIAAFREVGIDAHFNEDTPDSVLQQKVSAYEALDDAAKTRVAGTLRTLRTLQKKDLDNFLNGLYATLTRAIRSVYVIPLHGSPKRLKSLTKAISFIEGYHESQVVQDFVRYEIRVRYSNGDEVRGEFKSKRSAMQFLRSLM